MYLDKQSKKLQTIFQNLGGGRPDWQNDTFCDDLNNVEACDYDVGDCCGMNIDRRFCLECQCIRKSIKGVKVNIHFDRGIDN